MGVGKLECFFVFLLFVSKHLFLLHQSVYDTFLINVHVTCTAHNYNNVVYCDINFVCAPSLLIFLLLMNVQTFVCFTKNVQP